MSERWIIRVCDECGFEALERRPGESALTHAVHAEKGVALRDTFRLVEVVPLARAETAEQILAHERERHQDTKEWAARAERRIEALEGALREIATQGDQVVRGRDGVATLVLADDREAARLADIAQAALTPKANPYIEPGYSEKEVKRAMEANPDE